MADPALLETLSNLSDQLDALKTSIEPLLKVPFADLVSNDEHPPLAKAKLDVLVSYALHDLIWVYLKTSGVDPTNHPVMQEIERLKGYFGKLKSAESGAAPSTSGTPNDKRRMQIDKQAASRFINHAIASKRARIDPDYTPGSEDDIDMTETGTHTRFDAEDEIDADDIEAGVEKNEEVERLLDDKEEDDEEPEQARDETQEAQKAAKGKRKVLDPFAGYDQPKPSPAVEKRKKSDSTGGSTPLKHANAPTTGDAAGTPTSASKKSSKKKDKKKLRMKK